MKLESLCLPIAGASGPGHLGPYYDTVAADLNSGPCVARALPPGPSFQPLCGYDLQPLGWHHLSGPCAGIFKEELV